ncbi:hypothetical protein KUL42_39220 [Alteromonas sp. KUL42]|uniref:hypothetical protein n=1 Tax=Alteromonas sp. KUL42 TaxID=2480797 RepID=UPI001035A5E9|nr:hypothetical protein [Alteromonas sp. KUL42]TAP31727.1 hypothetical protein EYR97_19765 [Alteromonas sp. KUL42]GEA09161.1 hypothetical protein KUL42_39220 [Alteromonas sp. KUL42]
MSERETMTIIVMPSIRMFHFTEKTLAGLKNEAWYPYAEGKLFKCVEKYLVDSGIANNVTRFDEKISCGDSVDYVVTYNKAKSIEIDTYVVVGRVSDEDDVMVFVNAIDGERAKEYFLDHVKVEQDWDGERDIYIEFCINMSSYQINHVYKDGQTADFFCS